MTDQERTRLAYLEDSIRVSPKLVNVFCEIVMLHPGSPEFNDAVAQLRERPELAVERYALRLK
jgi:hypothetical protein